MPDRSQDSMLVEEYMTEQIRDLILLGPVHAFTYVSQRDPGCWMQISVHAGVQHYLTVLCVVPPNASLKELDKALNKVGRKQTQANQGAFVIYYLGLSESAGELLMQTGVMAQQCAQIVAVLWKARSRDQLALLGARGPRIPLPAADKPLLPEFGDLSEPR